MFETLWLTVASALALLGMGWLALAMDVHWVQVMPPKAAPSAHIRRILRTLGCLALPLSLLACLMSDRPSMAVLVWVMLLSTSSVVVALTLAHRPQTLRALWPIVSH